MSVRPDALHKSRRLGLFTRHGGAALCGAAICSRQLPANANLAPPNFYLNSAAVWSPSRDFLKKTSQVWKWRWRRRWAGLPGKNWTHWKTHFQSLRRRRFHVPARPPKPQLIQKSFVAERQKGHLLFGAGPSPHRRVLTRLWRSPVERKLRGRGGAPAAFLHFSEARGSG